MHVLVTGHTGFKGAWLVLMLRRAGHTVSGIALNPDPDSLFTSARLHEVMASDLRIDIRDAEGVARAFGRIAPDVVVHMAAQPLVRESYRHPRATIETNVLGTMNVLDAGRATGSVAAQLIVTTDKVYLNRGRVAGYAEDEALGAADPYSTSKAMADLLTQSWVRSFDGPSTAIARAGNVIGGGDHAKDRLLPDLMRAFSRDEPALIRYPDSVRPWQHVKDCLDGYLAIVDALLCGGGTGEWNIGPGPESFVTVAEMADLAVAAWGGSAGWTMDAAPHTEEAVLLALDATKAERELGWSNGLTAAASIESVVSWHRRVLTGEDPRAVTEDQLAGFEEQGAA